MINQAIRKTITCAVAVSATLGLGACTTLRVTSDVNQPLASTVRCQSFDWAGSFHGNSDSLRSTIANPVNEARLRSAIAANMSTVGAHQATEGADCLVGYGIGQRNVVDGYPGYYGGWGWGGGYGWGHRGWGGYGYRAGWELFLKHVAEDAPFPSPFLEGAKSVQLAEACYQSNRERRWIDLPELNL